MEILFLIISVLALLLQIRSSIIAEKTFNKKIFEQRTAKVKSTLIVKSFIHTWNREPEYFLYPVFYVIILILLPQLKEFFGLSAYKYLKFGMYMLLFIWFAVPIVFVYINFKKENNNKKNKRQ